MFNKHMIGRILWVENTLLHNKGPGPDFLSSQPIGHHTVRCQPWYIRDLWMVVESKLLHLVSLFPFYFLLSPQFTITVTTSQRSPICLMLLACLSIYISLVVSLSCLLFSFHLSPSCSCSHFLSVASVGGWLVSILFLFNLRLSSWSVSVLTYIIPHYPSSCISEFVFQDFSLFCFFFFFKFPLAPWPLFCLPLSQSHSTYLSYLWLSPSSHLSICIAASICLCSPPIFLYFCSHLSVPISVFTPVPPTPPRTNIYILCFCLTHIPLCWSYPFPLFDTLSYHPFSTSVTISLVGWLSSCACLLPPSFCSYVCFICVLSCLQFPVCLYLSLTKLRAWSLMLDCLDSNPSCVLTCKTAVPTSVLPRALNEITHVKFVELCLRQVLKNIIS